MQSVFGNSIKISLFGESHGAGIGIAVDGLAPGIAVDMDFINAQMEKRKPKGRISTSRHEADSVKIVSGCFNRYTTGTPLCIMIENSCQKNDYERTKDIARPSHADYTALKKYLGFQDYRGGGHFSGRLTAPLVAVGAIFLQILKSKGVIVGSHIIRCKDEYDKPFSDDIGELEREINAVNDRYFPVIDLEAEKRMTTVIENAASNLDSVGGVIESAVLGIPAGIGEPFFDSVESVLSHLLFSVPAVKGVEFGAGFNFADMYGSAANDPFRCVDGRIVTITNNNGGINGGITNGMPIKLRVSLKPTPSIYQTQQSVNMATGENVEFAIKGRHDPAVIHRARVVIDSVIAIGLADLFSQRFGYLWQVEGVHD